VQRDAISPITPLGAARTMGCCTPSFQPPSCSPKTRRGRIAANIAKLPDLLRKVLIYLTKIKVLSPSITKLLPIKLGTKLTVI
jgi:hypothetical protein